MFFQYVLRLYMHKGEKNMKKARYKAVVIVIIILFLAAVFVYFRPLRMSDLVNDEQEIVLTQISMGVQNGEPYMDSESYNDLTKEQEQSIINLFQQYTYRRTLSTFLVSDGSLSETGEQLVDIFMDEDSELVCSVIISNTGSISVNDRPYVLEDPSRFIEELLQIVE